MSILGSSSDTSVATLAIYTVATYLISYIIYRTYLDPLSQIPGPLICRVTSLWTWFHSYKGDEARLIDALHARYGPVLRIAPNEVIFSEGEALAPIYAERGGFLKSPNYANFDFEGHQTIFSARDPIHRAHRSKAVVSMFSTAAIRSNINLIEGCVDQFVQRLQREVVAAKSDTNEPVPVNILHIARALAIDTVSTYLFGKSYGGCDEKSQLSASTFVDSVVELGRLFFFPPHLFSLVFTVLQKLYPPSQDQVHSTDRVDSFTRSLIDEPPGDDLYQTRLLRADITPAEINMQLQDVAFAGTDTTGTNISTLLWNLSNRPSIYHNLQQEVYEAESSDPDYNPANLPYLEAILKETLRTSMANASRFPRIVPPSGWTYTSPSTQKSYFLPGGTQVGLQPWTLHFNPAVFPDPHSFKPERWLHPTKEMQRDWIPFNIGSRQCIARNLATMELALTARALAKSGILEGARVVQEKIEVREWFNAKIVGGKVELIWE